MKLQLIICIVALLSAIMGSQLAIAEQAKKGQGSHYRSFISKFDKNSDSIVSKQEFVTSMKQRYKKMDANGNGVVTQEEFKNNSKSRHKAYKKRKITKIDINNDGLISRQEYMDVKLIKAEKKFAAQDKNNDGFLSVEEHAKNKSKSSMRGHYFKKIDRNGDGEISFKENTASLERLFNGMDSNKDERITQDEMKSMGKRHHGKNQ